MEIPDNMRCLFSASVQEKDGAYVIEVPTREVTKGQVQSDQIYRVAVIETATPSSEERIAKKSKESEHKQGQTHPEPPVEKGEQRTVDIEDLGDQGDGITRVERGYVVIVPDTEPNERVRIEITDVSETVGFGEVIERLDYYE